MIDNFALILKKVYKIGQNVSFITMFYFSKLRISRKKNWFNKHNIISG